MGLRFALVLGAVSVVLAGCGESSETATVRAHRAAASAPTPPARVTGHRLVPRRGAVERGKVLPASALFGERVFANARDGFALANDGTAQYPAHTTDGGREWRIDGPQVHVDAADGPEAVGYVGLTGPRTFFAYGSSAVDVTTNAGQTWWEAFLGDLVVAVVPGNRPNELVALVQHSTGNSAITWQYVTSDGGHHWSNSNALGGG